MTTSLWLHLSPTHLGSSFRLPVYIQQMFAMHDRAASQSLILVFDVAVFSLTFARTIHHTMQMRKLKLGNSLGYVILRDGILYFLFQMVIHAAIITIYNIFNQGVDWAGEISVIGNVLVVILTCRLVLNLRQVSHTPELQSTSSGQIGTMTEEPEFATNSILGNLGAPLRIGPEFDDEDEVPIDDQMPLETLDAIPASPHH
ncbi:hypothetical protein BD410DRAFT_649016 [Rickenella mellea]|uniref:Uncharacterized protein n=1 Tax=Rickenella mellea TaxID=50990 RepID=A0A4Y7PMJ8_9AGAM|nr:hypothetical protein BD410DRAFT_649016 [Rickenella mellea]